MSLKIFKNLFAIEVKMRFLIPYKHVYWVCKDLQLKIKTSINNFKIKISQMVEKYKAIYNQKWIYANNYYTEILATINYMSPYAEISKWQINKLRFNKNKFYNFLTLKPDKKILQKCFDKQINPKDLRQANSLLRKYQLRTLELAKEIILPIKNKISFSMNGGTLIGALRHGGFIPWDDDLDFDLLRDDYDKFEKIVKEKYIWTDSSNCFDYDDFYTLINKAIEKYPNKIICTDSNGYIQAYRGTSFSDCVFVDFLPWEFINPKVDFKTYEKWWYEFAEVFRNPKICWGEVKKEYYRQLKESGVFSDRNTCKYIAKHCALTNFYYPSPKRFETIETFLPFKKYKFEDSEFYIANNYNTYLQRDYKNWLNIPVSIEFAKHLKLFGDLCKHLSLNEYTPDYDEVCRQEGYLEK